MKITDVDTLYLRLPQVSATRCDGTQDTLIVRVHTDEGLVGLGEVDSVPLVVAACINAPPSHAIAQGLRGVLLGQNPLDVGYLWQTMWKATRYFGRSGPAIHAMSGVDLALWDLLGQVTHQPVGRLLGGVYPKRLTAYASAVMPDSPDEAARLAERLAKLGYRALKFGWGPLGRDRDLDKALVRAIRNAVGPSMQLMIDVGGAFDILHALDRLDLFAPYELTWLEEPLAYDDLEGYKKLIAHSPTPIAAGEEESDEAAFVRLLDAGHLDIIQPDLSRCGGLTAGRKLAHLALSRHRKIIPHVFKTGILTAATVQFMTAIPEGDLIEYTVSESPLSRELVQSSIQLKNGYLEGYENSIGLGVMLNPEVVERFRVA